MEDNYDHEPPPFARPFEITGQAVMRGLLVASTFAFPIVVREVVARWLDYPTNLYFCDIECWLVPVIWPLYSLASGFLPMWVASVVGFQRAGLTITAVVSAIVWTVFASGFDTMVFIGRLDAIAIIGLNYWPSESPGYLFRNTVIACPFALAVGLFSGRLLGKKAVRRYVRQRIWPRWTFVGVLALLPATVLFLRFGNPQCCKYAFLFQAFISPQNYEIWTPDDTSIKEWVIWTVTGERKQSNWPAIRQGYEALEEQEYETAYSYFSQAIAISPSDAGAYAGRARCSALRKDMTAALQDANRSITLDPLEVHTRILRGRIRLAMNDFDHAIDDFQAGLECPAVDEEGETRCRSGMNAALVSRGNRLYNEGSYLLARDDYEAAVKAGPTKPGGLATLAFFYTKCPVEEFKNPLAAITNATRACELTNWTNADYMAVLFDAHRAAGNNAAALDVADKMLDFVPESRRAQIEHTIQALRKAAGERD